MGDCMRRSRLSAGYEVAACWWDDPQQVVALVRELAVNEVLDAAVDLSAAAELRLTAVPHFALMVTLSGVGLDWVNRPRRP